MRTYRILSVAGLLILTFWGICLDRLYAQPEKSALAALEKSRKLRQQHKYAEALSQVENAMRIYRQQQGEDSLDMATCHNLAGLLHWEMIQYTQAEAHHQRGLQIREAKAGKDDLTVATSLNNLAILYRDMGEYAKAEPLYQRSRHIREAKLGKDDLRVASTLNNLANLYRYMGEYAKSESMHQRSLQIREAKPGIDDGSVAQSLNNLAIVYSVLGQYTKAEQFCLRGLRMREAKLGKDHPEVAQSLNNLANLYRDMAQFAKAESLHQRSLRIREAKLGEDHPDVAQSLNNLALLFQDIGEYAKAEPLHRRSLRIRETKLGKDHPDVAESLNNLASLHGSAGRYAEAEPLYRRSLAICEARFGNDHPNVAESLNNLAGLNRDLGQYSKALPIYQRGLHIREAKLGRDHPEVAQSLVSLAGLYHDMGRYAMAESLYQQSLDIREAKLGKDHPNVAQSLNDWANLYRDMGQYKKAEQLYKSSQQIREAKLGADHPNLAQSLNNLANLYANVGQFAKAELLLVRSLQILETKLGKDHPDVAQALNNLANLYSNLGQFTKAEPLLVRSLQILETRLGKDHPNVAHPLNNLARVYRDMKQYAKAEQFYERSLQIREAKLGKDHPDLVTTFHNLADLWARQKNWSKAVDFAQKCRQGTANHLAEFLPSRSEQEQLIMLQKIIERRFHRHLSLGWSAREETQASSAEWLLNGKAVAHQCLAEQLILARDTKDPVAKQLVEELQQCRAHLAALINRMPKPGAEKEYQRDLQQLRASEQQATQKLARAVGRPYRANPWVKLDELRTKLTPKTVFVDIARLAVWDYRAGKSAGARYVAWVTPPQGNDPVQLIDLGEAERIDMLIEQTRKALIESAKSITQIGEIEAVNALQKPLMALSAQVLHPLLPTLEKYDEWIISPDGPLWLTPWCAMLLPDPPLPPLGKGGKGGFVIEQYLIRYVVSGRDLVLELPKTKTESAHVFADPDYDVRPGKPVATKESRQMGSALRTIPRVRRLPGTALEAEAVRPRLQQWLGQEPKVYLEGQASEAMVKSIKNPRVLAIATHGYFLPTQEAETKVRPGLELGQGKGSAVLFDKKGQLIENPLLRCGLLLAGCNERAKAKLGEDDGILTGLEIVGLNLNGCELVVLSACETGLGDVRNGEGVAGLRQAFQLAGAKGVLASLWQVPDRETALLMNAFYGELTKGRPQAEALRQAQLERIASRRGQFNAAHPFFWSAFVLTSRGMD